MADKTGIEWTDATWPRRALKYARRAACLVRDWACFHIAITLPTMRFSYPAFLACLPGAGTWAHRDNWRVYFDLSRQLYRDEPGVFAKEMHDAMPGGA